MQTVERVDALRAAVAGWRAAGERVAFVPTMGNLHAGHYALVRLARQHAGRVVASIFVNPTQFGPAEDFARYPRTPEQDAAGLREAGCALLFQPAVGELYPFGVEGCVRMHVPGLSDVLCGASRPGHFDGVATVVARLFNMVRPDVAVFGSKDFQQLQVIRRLVLDLAFPIAIVAADTVRESDGLAMSSRNRYLDPAQRPRAAEIHRTLQAMREGFAGGGDRVAVERAAAARLATAGLEVDYVQVRRLADLDVPEDAERDGLGAFIAARLGGTRLIDNLPL